ncbi:MAG TPA: hypothetical protein VGB29_03385 [Thermodesulfobacteriota bacterium]|jgi:hypothetical protein
MAVLNELAMDNVEALFFTLLFMAIGASHRAALHLLVTAHTLAMICTFEAYIRALLSSVIVIDDYGLMALSTRGGSSLWAMVVALHTIAGNIGMLAV